MKKTLIAIGVVICLAVAGNKIYEFYKSQQPPFAVGECFAITDPRFGQVKFQVLQNDKETSSSLAVGYLEIQPGVQVQIPVQATYQEIRESGAVAASCQ